MLRVWIFAATICLYWGMPPLVAAKALLDNGINDTTSAIDANLTPSVTTGPAVEVIDSTNKERELYYHPAEDRKPRVIEQFSRQFQDGTYEYKYVLSNGVTRYERSYWKAVGIGKKILARRGFYSHPLPNHKYMTVLYTADEHGFQQDTAEYSNVVPILPKHLDVPQLEHPHDANTIVTTTTTRKPTSTRATTTRKPRGSTTQRPIGKPSKSNWIY